MAPWHCSCISSKADYCNPPQRIDPSAIADTFVYLSQQPKGCWTHGVSIQRAFLRLLVLIILTYRAGHPSRRREVVKIPGLSFRSRMKGSTLVQVVAAPGAVAQCTYNKSLHALWQQGRSLLPASDSPDRRVTRAFWADAKHYLPAGADPAAHWTVCKPSADLSEFGLGEKRRGSASFGRAEDKLRRRERRANIVLDSGHLPCLAVRTCDCCQLLSDDLCRPASSACLL